MGTENVTIRHDGRPAFAAVNLEMLRRPDISLQAKGFISLLMSHSDGYKKSMQRLVMQSLNGRDATYRALREATEHGYVSIRRVRDKEGRFVEAVWTIHWTPKALRAEGRRSTGGECSHATDSQDVGSGLNAHVRETRSLVLPERIQQEVHKKEVRTEVTLLHWSAALSSVDRQKIEALLEETPGELAQQVVDELCWKINEGVVRKPYDYGKKLVTRALGGRFKPYAGIALAEARRRRDLVTREAEERRRMQRALAERVAAQRSDPEASARIQNLISAAFAPDPR